MSINSNNFKNTVQTKNKGGPMSNPLVGFGLIVCLIALAPIAIPAVIIQKIYYGIKEADYSKLQALPFLAADKLKKIKNDVKNKAKDFMANLKSRVFGGEVEMSVNELHDIETKFDSEVETQIDRIQEIIDKKEEN